MRLSKHAKRIATIVAFASQLVPMAATAQYLNLSNLPLYVGANVAPQVMLTISKDQQLYKKAYNDYSDLDGDGLLETTYKHAISYYGYFDSFKCYDYDVANLRFVPFGTTTDKFCTGANANKWSGNFLNWGTMSRMDAVRKLLYGGLRSTDTSALTVLERTYLPTEAHSSAKYYNGTDAAGVVAPINQLTPFNPPTTAPTKALTSASFAPGTGVKTFSFTGTLPTGFSIGDQVVIAGNAANTMTGVVACTNVAGTQTNALGQTCTTSNQIKVDVQGFTGTTAFTAWTLTDFTPIGITFCNTTLGGTGALGTGAPATPQFKSQTNTNPPLIRVASGNFGLWTSNERWQCFWREETAASAINFGTYGGNRNNGNKAALSGLTSGTFEPIKATHGLGQPDYVARVEACRSTLLGQEKCKQYPNGNYKPVGLLQVYAEPGLLQFGLMTGSYDKNVSGGVLRKNIGGITDEINTTTDGTFKSAALASGYAGIVNTLNRMRLYGYYYGDGTYLGATGDNCNFQLTSITQGSCTSWGNPMSEIYYETLRYLAGGKPTSGGNPQPTAAYTYTYAGSKEQTLGLPLPAWTDPITQNNYCAPLNTIVFNASVSSSDDDQAVSGSTKTVLGSVSLASSFTAAIGAKTATQWTDQVGQTGGENIHGNSYFIGRSGALTNEFCDAKNVTSLGSISGICPEGPTQAGSYKIAGLAYATHINHIRSDLTVPASNTTALKVNTYGVQLATNVPQLALKLSGETTPRVVIQPAYRLFNVPPQGGGTLVELKIVAQSPPATDYVSGLIYLNWEDSEQGGDYDQDMWGVMSYCMVTGARTSCPALTLPSGALLTFPVQGVNTVAVTTQTLAQSTGGGQGFGYIISGTNKDGPHFHSGILGHAFTDPTGVTVINAGTVLSPVAGASLNGTTQINASGGCANCRAVSEGVANTSTATKVVYTLGAGTGRTLNDPLWYAAKWGGFKEGTGGNNKPDLQSEFDIKDTNGNNNPDGIPDNYFLVNNPLGLESALDKAFVAILTTSSASSVATNSTSLNTGSRVYQARFNSNDWSGQLLSFTIDLNGVISSTPEWDTGQKILGQSPASRVIYTWDDSTLQPTTFHWGNLNATQQSYLNTSQSNTNDGMGAQRVDYLRGDAANEGLGVNNFRRRVNTKLGDVVNSNPQYVGSPSASGAAYSEAAYTTFKNTWASRKPMIYVGANDGMLHAVDAGTSTSTQGTVLMSYVPSQVYYKLSWLTAQGYLHRYFVDGTPAIADVKINGAWRSVLIGALAGGGQGVFALDVTDPTQFTEANASNIVLWEFNDTDYRGLGYTYGQPRIAKMANGKWAAIVAVGYNDTYSCSSPPCPDRVDNLPSTTGRGRVFVIFIENGGPAHTWNQGTDYIVLDTRVGSSAAPDGVASPTPVDVDGDGKVDFIYFGDLQGNMWKWDVTDSDPNDWKPAFGSTSSPLPLYNARDASNNVQPITSSPVVFNHPNGGLVVLFGTGQYLQPTDPNGPYTLHTFYGIWDQQTKTYVNAQANPSASRVATSVTTPRNSTILQKQSILAETTVSGIAFRVNSDNIPDWTFQRGWYLDLLVDPTQTSTGTLTGERVVFDAFVRNGKIVVDTLVPSTVSCDSGGTSWLMDLDAATGRRPTESPFDVNGDRNFSTGDKVNIPGIGLVYVSGRQSQVGVTPRPTVIAGTPGKEFKVTSGSTGGMESILENPGGGALTMQRRSWREILRN